MKRITTALLATAGAAMMAGTIAGPASATNSASHTQDGCTVTAKWPRADGINGSGVTMVAYEVEVTCASGREVEIDQRVWEQDLITREGTAPDTLVHTRPTYTKNFANAAGTKSSTLRLALPNADANDPVEEVYSDVAFRVITTGPSPVTGAWSPHLLTQPRAIQ